MGLYINKGNDGFLSARRSEYVDKSGLIAVVNQTLLTEQRFSCYIPNKEVDGEMVKAVKYNHWTTVADALQQSE